MLGDVNEEDGVVAIVVVGNVVVVNCVDDDAKLPRLRSSKLDLKRCKREENDSKGVGRWRSVSSSSVPRSGPEQLRMHSSMVSKLLAFPINKWGNSVNNRKKCQRAQFFS